MTSIFHSRIAAFISAMALFASSNAALADSNEVLGVAKPWQLNFQEAATPVMEQLTTMHDALLILTTAITVFVMILLGYVCVRFSRKNNPIPSTTTHNTMLEVVWTVVPVLILIAIFIPSWRLHYYMDQAVDPDMTLKVTGKQWYWTYTYPDLDELEYDANIKKDDELGEGDIRLLSTDNPVVIPVNKTIRVLTTGADVIHAWAVPAFGVKQDTVPGRLNETWFKATKTGIFYGQCSELCGKDHGFMPIEVHVVEQPLFDAWAARAQKDGDYTLAGLNVPAAAPAAVEAPAAETTEAAPAAE